MASLTPSKKGERGSTPKKEPKEDKAITYEFDASIDLEALIDDEINYLDLEEEFQRVLNPVESQIKHIERRTRDIDKIFADANEQMMIFKKAIEDQQFIESSSESSSDKEVIVDDDDDVQFITTTVSTERRRPQSQATTVTSSTRLANSGQIVHAMPNAMNAPSGQGSNQFVQAKYIRIVPGEGQQASHIESTAIVQRRIPFYRTLKRPIPNELVCGMKLLGKKINDIWYKGTLVDIVRKEVEERKFVIKFDGKGKKALNGKQVAMWDSADTLKLPLGTRVVAMYKDEDALPSVSHYAGIVAEPPSIRNSNRYLIFFDDGYAQYNEPKTVHQVFEQSFNVWEDIPQDSSEFIRSYLEQYPERPMVRLQSGQVVKTEWMGKWWTARVVEVDASLVKMFFDADKRTEWIYRGTTRLEPLYTELSNAESQKTHGKARRHTMGMKRSNKPYVEYTRGTDAEYEAPPEKVPATPPTPSSPGDPPLAVYQPSGIQQQTARKSTASRAVAKKSTFSRQPSFESSSNSSIKKEFKQITVKREPISYSPSSKEKLRKSQHDYEDEHQGEQVAKHINKIAPTRKDRKPFVKHKCHRDCVKDEDDPFKFKGQNPLLIPMLCGWERHISKVRGTGGGTSKRHVYYRAPCGRMLRTIDEADYYLMRTDSKVTIDWFCYDPACHPFNEFVPVKTFCDIKDLSYGKENVPISCVNGMDRQYPEYVEYSNQRFPAKGVKMNLDSDFLVCCDCTDGCRDKSKCACCQLTINATMALPGVKMGDPSAGYETRRIKEPNITGIYECNQKCKCDYRCANRVAQHGLQHRLQVFKTDKKGWGLRCLDDVPQGGFICIYAGQVLTDEDANEDGHQYGDEYLAELDHIEVVERFKEGYEEDAIDPAESGEEDDDEDKEENMSDSTYSAGAHSDDSGMAPGRYSTRKRNKRKQSKDDDAKGVGKLLIRRSSADGKDKSSWSIQSLENEQQTAEWVSRIPDKMADETDESKDPAFALDTDELPDLVPGSGKPNGKKDGIGGLKITEPTSLNTDNVDSDDSDDSPLAHKRTKAETSRFSNLPDPKNKKPGEKQKDTQDQEDNDHITIGLRSLFNEEFCYIMDAKSIGNIGRYLNHSCSPNVFVQNVFVDTHDLRFPWVAFFALTFIRAGTELTWDYNYEVGSVPGKVLYCYCGSADCRGRLL